MLNGLFVSEEFPFIVTISFLEDSTTIFLAGKAIIGVDKEKVNMLEIDQFGIVNDYIGFRQNLLAIAWCPQGLDGVDAIPIVDQDIACNTCQDFFRFRKGVTCPVESIERVGE